MNKDLKSTIVKQDGSPKSMGRRALLRGGVTAMPAILTLHSGAALARSSNLISAAPGSRDANGDVWCMDTSTATKLDGKYDYQDPGYATVNVIPDTAYYEGPGQSGTVKTADEFCASGGTANYKLTSGGALQTGNLQSPGIVVSSNAYNSVSSRIDVWVNDWTKLT